MKIFVRNFLAVGLAPNALIANKIVPKYIS